MVVVPHQLLQPDTLQALIEDFVTRDGAVQGHSDPPLHLMVDSVLRQLQVGTVVIGFDESAQSFTILPKEQMRADDAVAEEPPEFE